MHDSPSMCSPTILEAWESDYYPKSSTTTEGSEHYPKIPRGMTAPRELPNTGTREKR